MASDSGVLPFNNNPATSVQTPVHWLGSPARLLQVVYLNGAEVGRVNMPSTAISPTTLASAKVVAASYSSAFVFSVPMAKVVSGTNVVAVEVSSGPPKYPIPTHNLTPHSQGHPHHPLAFGE